MLLVCVASKALRAGAGAWTRARSRNGRWSRRLWRLLRLTLLLLQLRRCGRVALWVTERHGLWDRDRAVSLATANDR